MCIWVGEEKQRSQMTSHSDSCVFQGCVCCNGSAFKSSQAALNSQHLRFPMISRLIFPIQRCIMKTVINILQQIGQSYLSVKQNRDFRKTNKQAKKRTTKKTKIRRWVHPNWIRTIKKKKKSAFTFKKKDHPQRCSLKGCEMNDKNQVGMRVNNASMVWLQKSKGSSPDSGKRFLSEGRQPLVHHRAGKKTKKPFRQRAAGVRVENQSNKQ